MSRKDFMTELERLLSDISGNERDEALKYYNDYFNDAGEEKEQDVIKELGSPEKVAKTIKEGIYGNNINTPAPPKPLPGWAIALIIAGGMLLIVGSIGTFIIVKSVRLVKTAGDKAFEIIEERSPELEEIIKDSLPDEFKFQEHHDDNHHFSFDIGDALGLEAADSMDFKAADVKNLDVSFGRGIFIISEKDTDDGIIEVKYDGDALSNCVNYSKDERTLYIKTARNAIAYRMKDIDKCRMEIILPKGFKFEEVELKLGACTSEIYDLRADETDIDVGACEITINDIQTDELTLDVGAGKASLYDMDVNNAEIKVGVGETDCSGNITGSLEAEVGLGAASFRLSGNEKDRNYEIDCGMGAVKIGSTEMAGLSKDKYIDNNAAVNYDLKCGMGSLEIIFDE